VTGHYALPYLAAAQQLKESAQNQPIDESG
jgi:hypothetical protein